MSYLDTFNLSGNFQFQSRVAAASTEQALIFVNDARPEFSEPAQRIILAQGNAAPFYSLVAGQPGMTAESEDLEILAALQAVWPQYGAALLADEGAPA